MCMLHSLLKMAIEVTRSPITEVTAYFALVLDIETMKLVQPIRNGLSIPTKRHVFGIVNGSITINFIPLGFALRLYGFLLQLALLRWED